MASEQLFDDKTVENSEPLNDIWNSTQLSYFHNDTFSNSSLHALNQSELSSFHHLFHQPIHLQFRVAVLWILAVMGSVGNVLVIIRICALRNWRSRINLLIFHLALADGLVIVMAICPQLAWEYAQRQWEMGDGMCRIFKFLQTAVISLSNFMVVVLAVDRYCAIRRPLKKAFTVGCLTGSAWISAIILNCGNFFLFETKEIDGEMYCRNKLYDLPQVFMQAYLTTIAVFVFVVPLLFICFTYARIFQKIANRKKCSFNSGKIQLQSTLSSTLPKAKVKTFKMTIVILSSFLICGTPYFVCDIFRVYNGQTIPPTVWAILGSLAVSNSCTNPFVFLGFNSTFNWWSMFIRGRQPSTRNRLHISSRITLQANADNNHITLQKSIASTCQPILIGSAATLIQFENVDTCVVNDTDIINPNML